MDCRRNPQERRIKQRRRLRTDIKFPLIDNRGCIVPFDRSRMADRRLITTATGAYLAGAVHGAPVPGYLRSTTPIDIYSFPALIDNERNFCITGEMIACVNNIYNSQSPGRWKELELYQTPTGQYVCLEIWRTSWTGKYDQYWLATCDDLKTAREFFGNNALASELFDAAAINLIGTGD